MTTMSDVKLPRGALTDAAAGISEVVNLGPGLVRRIAKAGLESALPGIERAVLRDAAKYIGLLDDLARGIRCPACHAKPAGSRYDLAASTMHYSCGCGREWSRGPRAGTDYTRTADRSLARLARGEPLPDLPAREEGENDGSA
jgi:hypothetical protein